VVKITTIFEYLGNVSKKAVKGEPLSIEEQVITAMSSLFLATVAVPLAVAGAKAAYDYYQAKQKR